MRDHWRILGTLFYVWAGLQGVGLVLGLVLTRNDPAMAGKPSWWLPVWLPVATLVTLLLLGLYVWCGTRLRQHRPQARVPALLLSVLSLFSLPLGLAVGLYGLWVLMRFREAPHPA